MLVISNGQEKSDNRGWSWIANSLKGINELLVIKISGGPPTRVCFSTSKQVADVYFSLLERPGNRRQIIICVGDSLLECHLLNLERL